MDLRKLCDEWELFLPKTKSAAISFALMVRGEPVRLKFRQSYGFYVDALTCGYTGSTGECVDGDASRPIVSMFGLMTNLINGQLLGPGYAGSTVAPKSIKIDRIAPGVPRPEAKEKFAALLGAAFPG